MITGMDIAWAAGFLEGEGCFFAKDIGVFAAQVQREPLERLQKMLGGNIRPRPAPDNFPNGQPQNYWSIHGTRAAGAMMMLWSLMSPRRQGQIEEALAIWKSRHKRGGPKTSHGLRYCIRGHDQDVVGRTIKGCRQCVSDRGREEMRRYRAEKKEDKGG